MEKRLFLACLLPLHPEDRACPVSPLQGLQARPPAPSRTLRIPGAGKGLKQGGGAPAGLGVTLRVANASLASSAAPLLQEDACAVPHTQHLPAALTQIWRAGVFLSLFLPDPSSE